MHEGLDSVNFTASQSERVKEFADLMKGSNPEDAPRLAHMDQEAATIKAKLKEERDLDLNDPQVWFAFMEGVMFFHDTYDDRMWDVTGDKYPTPFHVTDDPLVLVAAMAPPEIHSRFGF